MRREILEMDLTGNRRCDLSERPDRVWFWSLASRPPEDVVPSVRNSRFEDYLHDWNWQDGVFRYSGVGHTQDSVWLVLEYDDDTSDPTIDCESCGQELPAHASFCMTCGEKV